MIILLITLLCTLYYLIVAFGFVSDQIIFTFNIIILMGTLGIISYYSIIGYYHPLEKRIQALEKLHPDIQHYQVIVNLSSHPIAMQTEEGFNVRFHNCVVNGFVLEHTLYLLISHPEHHFPSLALLWAEIGKCHTRFNGLCLAITPTQLTTLKDALQKQWLFVARLLQSSPSASILINDDKMSKSMYYVKEYGTLPDPILINPSYKLLTKLQQSNLQINYWIQKLFDQRNDLCIYPPIDDTQKQHLFQLSQILLDLKTHLLNMVVFCTESNIPLHSIGFELGKWTKPRPNLIQKYHLVTTSVLLSILAITMFSTMSLFKSQINASLLQSEGAELAKKLYTLERYPQYKSIQRTHLERLQSQYLDNTKQAKDAYLHLFSNHAKSESQFKIEVVTHLTNHELNDNIVYFLSKQWFKKGSANKPALSDIAPIISETYIPKVCQVLEPYKTDNCIQVLKKIKTYQSFDHALQKLENTIIPIDANNHQQTLRQLSYLTKNPKHIGQEALRQLDKILVTLSEEGHTLLIQKAKEIRSTIQLLKSQEGQYLLNRVKTLYEMDYEVTSNEEAHQILQQAYISDRHPLREIKAIKRNLAPHQAAWLANMTDHIIDSLSQKANTFLKDTWNEDIYPELKNLQAHYPFSEKGEPITPEDMSQAFYLVDYFFDRYIRMFVQDEEDDIVVKPYGLGIQIPDHVLMLYIYTKVLASGIDMKKDHFHAAWAISLKEIPYPIEAIYLHAANKKLPLQLQRGSVLHWDSRYPIGFDVVLQNGETISIIQNNDWSILQLFSQFKELSPLCYQYQSPDHSWQFSVEAKPQYPINILNSELLHNLPFSTWQ